jgi:hypothetical protein
MFSSGPDSFDTLQARLQGLGPRALSDLETGTIVVLPSITFPADELKKIVGIGRYEERLLCLLLLLRQPGVRMVYATSLPVYPEVIDYYLSFLDDPAGAAARLTMVTLDDPEPIAMSEKLLARKEKLEEIRRAIGDDEAYLLPFNVTPAERAIATELDAPIYGPGPGLAYIGSKSGSRHAAREAGVAVPLGAEDLNSLDAIDAALRVLKEARPGARSAVIKLNYGFSGQGNAVVDLDAYDGDLRSTPVEFCASEESWATFEPKIERDGSIVEEMLRAPTMVSPSVQLRIAPDGTTEVLSTHDQILGGPDDQVYLGCRFPARADYRADITEAAIRVGKVLAAKGVVGAFGMDFLVLPGHDGNGVFLSEINLRLGGTSHPFYMARFATGGTYDQSSGELNTASGPVSYVATDNLKSEAYRSLTPGRLVDELRARQLAFDPQAGSGVTVHLLGAMSEHGKVGATCIAHGPEAADDLYADFVSALDELTS